MCGRTALYLEPDQIVKTTGIETWTNSSYYNASYNVAPTCYQPVIRREGNDQILDCLKWGIRLSNKNVINTRSDSLYKPFWASKNRCIVLIQGYYEWSDSPHYISKSNELLYVAGLYSSSKNDDSGYSIVTIEANPQLESIHHRMPLILKSREMVEMWINDTESIDSLPLVTGLTFWEVGSLVNKVGNNSQNCIKQVNGKTLITDYFKLASK